MPPDDAALAALRAELVEAVARAEDLRGQLADRDALVQRAGEALVRDAAEVVRVVAELERKDASLKSDLQEALRFQRAMIAPLPSDPRMELEAVYLAAEVISGD